MLCDSESKSLVTLPTVNEHTEGKIGYDSHVLCNLPLVNDRGPLYDEVPTQPWHIPLDDSSCACTMHPWLMPEGRATTAVIVILMQSSIEGKVLHVMMHQAAVVYSWLC